MSRKIQFICLFVLLGLLSLATQPGFAQSPPLNFGNNFFVTGDYIVAGAYGINTNFTKINGVSYTTGVISVPDPNPGITGANQVPKGAQIVAALLYWQTIEKAGVAPGATGSGQNGYIRPLLYSKTGGPAAPGYAFSGTNVSPSSNVSWGPGGCSGTSTGNVRQTYRADVAGSLPLDANGNPTANGFFEVRLPSAGEPTPFTLGATLVVIYRILSGAGGPNIPLNSIVIYDGDYAAAKPQLTMTQQLQGFYDAAHNPVSRLTHIVGNGDDDSYETVYLNSKALPSLYGRFLPPFPGYYRNWDNPTWTFTSASHNPANPVTEDSSSATTQVVPFSRVDGCVSWGAVIVSTTVKNSDNDGILDSWKDNHGYCDVALNPSCSPGDPAWVDLTGAAHNQQDVFLQYDYMCSKVQGPASSANSCAVAPGGDYSFDPRLAVDTEDGLTPHASAIDKVVASYASNNGSNSHHLPVVLHAMPGNAISESQTYDIKGINIVPATCTDSDLTCPFPNEPGTIGFREGLAYIKNQTIEPQTGLIGCDPNTDPNTCVAVFPHGKKDSYHYALFSHGVGLPNWFLSDGSLSSVKQSGNTVTFTTSLPHGISHIANDNKCPLGRVTIVFAITNSALEGTYCVLSNPAPTAKTFAVSVGGSPTTTNYTLKTDPNLAVANGQVTSMSGYSDVGGQNSVISLGYGNWGPPNNPASDGNKWQMKAGTFMHELGHTMAQTHGGAFYNKLPNNPNDYTPTYEANCKPNVQSVMSYLFQFDLLEVPGQLNAKGNPLMVVDYSEDPPPLSPNIPTLTESAPVGPGILNNLSYAKTAWFQLTSFAGGTPVSPHCDGTPLVPGEQPVTYVPGSTSDFFWSSATGEDINFNGNSSDVMHGHNEWEGTPAEGGVGPAPGLDLRQVSAVGTISTIGPGGEAGGLKPAGGGGGLKPAGGGGGLKPAGGGGGLHPAGGGGGLKPAGGGGLSAEITHEAANSYTRPPRDLTIVQEEASPRLIDLTWFAPTFGQIVQYNIYRSDASGPFNLIHSNTGNPPATTYQDTVTCNTGGYRYRVTAFVFNDVTQKPQESVASNTVPVAPPQALLTGCYTVSAVTYPNGANAVQGSIVPITWTLKDDFYATPADGWANAVSTNPVANLAASTLVANGPLPGNCGTVGATTILSKGNPQSGASTFSVTNPLTGQFTFSWDTDPFCAGSYTFTLTLDSTQTQPSASALQLAIDVNDQDTPHINPTNLPDATVGVGPYNQTLTEDGGVGAVTWSISQGSLPNGITISNGANNTGVLSGYATTAGTYHFTAQAKDSKGNIGTQAFTLIVHIFVSDTQPSPLPPFTINTTPPDATVGILYTNQVYQSGAVGAVTWSVSSGSLPNGITLNTSTGVLSGYATTAGAYQFTATATDPQNNTGTQTFTLKVHIFVSDTPPPANPPFTALTVLPDATVGIPYSNTVYESGGVSDGTHPFTWTGSAPGLSFAANAVGVTNGTLIGTPTSAGIYVLPTQVMDSAGNTGTQTFTLTVHLFVSDAPAFSVTTTLPDGTVGAAYSNTPVESGGTGPFNWTVTSGTTPPGLQFDSSSGKLSATPIVPPPGELNFVSQLYSFTVQVTDSAVPNNSGTQAFTLRLITPVSLKRTDSPTGKNPIGVIAADFNGDGKMDLAIANNGDNTVSILLSNGDGTFTAAQNSPLATGSGPYSLAAADLNGDGKLDLVVTNSGDNNVSVFLGNGDGTFQTPAPTYPVGTYPSSVVSGDFNGDGFVDLAVANQNDHTVSILLGNGDGTFQSAVTYQAGTTDVAAVATGDFNGDGKLDLALTNPSSGTISVLLGNGDGTFSAAVAYATGNPQDHPIAVTAFDFNGDGKLDLAVTNLNAKNVAILLGNGDGTFKAAVPYPTTNGGLIGPSAMTTGDFNGDNKVDLAIIDQQDNTVSILLGNGDGTFQSPLEFSTGKFPVGVAAADFNGDGRLDLAVANQTDNTFSVMLHLPQPPTNLAVPNVASGQVTLGWSVSTTTPIAGYNVYQATTSGGPYTKLNGAPVPAGTLTYTDSSVSHGTTYYYVVTAVDAGSLESVNSNEVSAAP